MGPTASIACGSPIPDPPGTLGPMIRAHPVRMVSSFLPVAQAAGALTLTWSAAVGQTCQMQYCANLIQGGWSTIGGPIRATNGAMITIDPAPTDPRRFYRIVLQQTVHPGRRSLSGHSIARHKAFWA